MFLSRSFRAASGRCRADLDADRRTANNRGKAKTSMWAKPGVAVMLRKKAIPAKVTEQEMTVITTDFKLFLSIASPYPFFRRPQASEAV